MRRILLPGQRGEADIRVFNGADFVDFIHIDNENALAQRYIADIDICFDAARIRSALMEKNLQWSELVTAPIFITANLVTRQGCGSGRKNVLWLDSWRQRDSLVQITTLTPDFVLERQLKGSLFLAEDAATLQKAAQAAQAVQIVLLYAGLDYSTAQPVLKLTARLFDGEGKKLATIAEQKIQMNATTSMQFSFEDFSKKGTGCARNQLATGKFICCGRAG